MRKQHPETLAVHAGRRIDPETGAVATPLHLSSTFERAADGEYPLGYMYSRYANPTRQALEAALAALEGGDTALAFASGSAAAQAVFQSFKPGDHIVMCRDAYHGIRRQLAEIMQPWGLRASYVDTTDLAAVRAAITPATRLVWVETPSNPLLKISDLASIASLARGHDIVTLCDSTFATPLLQRPLDYGMDLVLHSTTKYIGGHSDLLGGAVIARENGPLTETLRHRQGYGGAVPAPFDCWLMLRSLSTLSVRVRAQTATAERLAHELVGHPAVERVYYPGLATHPGHAIAIRQMAGFGGMLSIAVKGNEARAVAIAAKVRLFTRATSLGGVESLIEHRASIEGPDSETPRNLLRLSVGLEHADDLLDDLRQALA